MPSFPSFPHYYSLSLPSPALPPLLFSAPTVVHTLDPPLGACANVSAGTAAAQSSRQLSGSSLLFSSRADHTLDHLLQEALSLLGLQDTCSQVLLLSFLDWLLPSSPSPPVHTPQALC